MIFSGRNGQMYYDDGHGGDGERRGIRAEVRARTLMGKTVLAVLRKLHSGQVLYLPIHVYVVAARVGLHRRRSRQEVQNSSMRLLRVVVSVAW